MEHARILIRIREYAIINAKLMRNGESDALSIFDHLYSKQPVKPASLVCKEVGRLRLLRQKYK